MYSNLTFRHALAATIAVSGSVFCTLANASGDKSYVSLAATKTEDKSRGDGATSKRATTIFQLTGLYALGSGFGLGAKYFNYSQDDDLLDNDGMEISAYGPTAGFSHTTGFFLNIAYLLSPKKTFDSSGGHTVYDGGNGYVIDMGKVWEFGGSFGAGLQVSQSKTKYKKVSSNGSESDLSGEWSDSSFYPYASLFFFF